MSASEAADWDAVRVAYDTVAADYATLLRDEIGAHPVDRAMLTAFADLVRDDGAGPGTNRAPVADLGCGPGRVAAHLDGLGVVSFGVDLSAAMIAEARSAHPHLRFEQGSMTALTIADASLAGAVAWYSIIHTPPHQRPQVYGELFRVLRPGGHLLVAFQVGDEHVRLERAYGHDVSLEVWRLAPDVVIGDLATAGLVLDARVIREPTGRDRQQQAFLLFHRPA